MGLSYCRDDVGLDRRKPTWVERNTLNLTLAVATAFGVGTIAQAVFTLTADKTPNSEALEVTGSACGQLVENAGLTVTTDVSGKQYATIAIPDGVDCAFK